MKNDTFRIVQISDYCFHVEKERSYLKYRPWPWSKKEYGTEFVSAMPVPFPFKTEAHAQKWIDDQRKYPIVVKEAA
ncbi:MAG: hypothetical protein ACRYFZ_19515 [Janthinobacterium lividum]